MTLSMVDVINRGMAPRRKLEIPKPCPCCKSDAPLASQDIRRGHFYIRCEDESCADPLYVEGETLGEVWAEWNSRA
jgi:hypothetical protein